MFPFFSLSPPESDTLCLQSAPKSNLTYFTSSPHAALLGNAKAITTYSISYTLQSIGGIKALLPLLNKFSGQSTAAALSSIDTDACSTIIGFICDLLESSPHWFGNEVLQSYAFVIISSFLMKNARVLINEKTLDIILNLTKTLISASVNAGNSDDSVLLKQLMDSILFNSSLWIYVNSKLQIRLYSYLATEFLSTGVASNSPNSQQANAGQSTADGSYSNSSSASGGAQQTPAGPSGGSHLNGIVFGEVRRISTVLQLLHSLKYYYWVVPEDLSNHQSTMNNNYELMNALKGSNLSASIQPIQVRARDSQLRPCKSDLITIRGYILLFIKQLIIKGNGVHHDELQAILNYLTTVFQDENLIDVLQMLQTLMIEHSASMIPGRLIRFIRFIFSLKLTVFFSSVRREARNQDHLQAVGVGKRADPHSGPQTAGLLPVAIGSEAKTGRHGTKQSFHVAVRTPDEV